MTGQDACSICRYWPEPPMECAGCGGIVCMVCEHKLKICPFCGEDECPECIKPDDHDCPEAPMDVDEEEE